MGISHSKQETSRSNTDQNQRKNSLNPTDSTPSNGHDSTPSNGHEDRVTTTNNSTVQPTKDDDEADTSRHPVVIAIDLGTTYTGYAYQFINQYNINPEKISIPQPFNGGKHNLASTRTPTCILINDKLEVDSFGYEAEDRFEEECINGKQDQFYFFKQFKMNLHGIKGLDSSFLLQDHEGKKSLPVNKVFILAIKALKKHALDTVKKEILNIDEKDILWVLTVPAIWDEEAVKFMKDVATSAGIGDNFVIAYEPEAAAFACKYYPLTATTTFSDIQPGTHYMVVDLGGGTADIVIHKKLGGNKVKEVLRPSGGPWGGKAVDNKFIQFLTDIVGEPVFKRFREERHSDYIDLFREFEAKKRGFPQDICMEKKVYLKIPMALSELCKEETGKDFWETVQQKSFADKVKFKGGMTVFDPEIFETFFRDISNQIISHIKDLIATSTGAKVSFILVVGGFSQSSYIQQSILDSCKGGKIKIIFPNEPELSVVKGAIIFARQSKLMGSRLRDALSMVTLAVGMDVSSLGLQFKYEYLQNPNHCWNVFEPGKKEATQPCCLLLEPSNKVYDTGMMAQKKYWKLCNEELDHTWHFFHNIYSKQSGEDTVEDHRRISRKAMDILSIYIKHEWQYMWFSFEKRKVALSMARNDVFTVIAVPAVFSENAQTLVIRAAEMAGIKEETLCIVSESEAIYNYVRIGQTNKYQELASAPAGSRIAIVNWGGTRGDLTFHQIQGQSLSAPYELASVPWGSRSIANGILEILAEVVGTSTVEKFEKMSASFTEFCTRERNSTLQIMIKNSIYSSQIEVNRAKMKMTGNLPDPYFRRAIGSITEQVEQSLIQSSGGEKNFMILTGEFADFEEITNVLLSYLDRKQIHTILVPNDESPILRGASIFGWRR